MLNNQEKRKYLKWYRLAQTTINDNVIIPYLDDDKIIDKLVSGENWLCLVSTEIDLNNAKNSHNPNIYIQTNDDKMDIGLVFNSAPSIDKINNILLDQSKEQRDKIVKLLQHLDDRYHTTLGTTTRKKHFAEFPTYGDYILDIHSNKIDDTFIEKMFIESQRLRSVGKEKMKNGLVQFEGPHIGLMRIEEMPISEEEFKKAIKDMIEVWKVCISVKDSSNIRSEARKQIKELDKQKKNIEGFISRGLHLELKIKLEELNKEIEKLKEFDK